MAIIKNETGSGKTFLKIGTSGPVTLPNGKVEEKVGFLQTVTAETEGAIRRDWAVGTKTGTKYELVHGGITGMIVGITFKTDGDYGNQMQIEMSDGEVIQMSTSGRFGQDLLTKLPEVDLSKELFMRAYDYIPEGKTKASVGVSIKQGEDKIGNHFFDFKTRKSINGMPTPDFKWGDDSVRKSAKDAYWEDVEVFLREYVEKNVTNFVKKEETVTDKDIASANADNQIAAEDSLDAEFTEDISPEDIPF